MVLFCVTFSFPREENPEEKGGHSEKRDCKVEKLVHPGSVEFFTVIFYFKYCGRVNMLVCYHRNNLNFFLLLNFLCLLYRVPHTFLILVIIFKLRVRLL